MEIPFETILDTQFTNAAPGSGLATFMLSEPPHFYLENVSSPRPDSSGGRVWKRCADWTEGMQATRILRHDLIGGAVQLAHLLRNLSTSTQGSDIRLHSPSYHNSGQQSPVAPDVAHPPMANLNGPGYHQAAHTLDIPRSDYLTEGRRRSYPGSSQTHHSRESNFGAVELNAAADIHGSSPAEYNSYSRPPTRAHSYHSPMFSDYNESESHQQSPVDFESPHASNGHSQPSYSQPVPRNYFHSEERVVSSYNLEGLRRNSSNGSMPGSELNTPSPPLLTTPFHPPPELLHGPKPSEVMTGLPGMSYESDDDLHHGQDIS